MLLKYLMLNFQLDSNDEQAAAIRRELDARQERLQEMQRVRKIFVIVSFLLFLRIFTLCFILNNFRIKS